LTKENNKGINHTRDKSPLKQAETPLSHQSASWDTSVAIALWKAVFQNTELEQWQCETATTFTGAIKAVSLVKS